MPYTRPNRASPFDVEEVEEGYKRHTYRAKSMANRFQTAFIKCNLACLLTQTLIDHHYYSRKRVYHRPRITC